MVVVRVLLLLLLRVCVHVVCPECGRHASECDKTCGFCDLNLDGDGHRRRRRNQIISGDSAECPFANYQDRVDSVNAACCDEPGICDNGVPVRKRKRNTATRLSRSRNRPSSWDRIVACRLNSLLFLTYCRLCVRACALQTVCDVKCAMEFIPFREQCAQIISVQNTASTLDRE